MSSKVLQTAVLAAATLLFLIELPLVSCRRRNTFNVEELGKYFSAKDYDQGKRHKGTNQADNALPKCDVQQVCNMMTSVLDRLGKNSREDLCKNISNNVCYCSDLTFDGIKSKCNTCLVSPNQHVCNK